MKESEDLKNKGLAIFTKSLDHKYYTCDGIITQSNNNKIILDFFIDRILFPSKAIYNLDKDDNFLEPPIFLKKAKIEVERNIQFSLSLSLESAYDILHSLQDAIDEAINKEDVNNDTK